MLYKHKKMRLLFFKTFLFSIAQSIQKRTDKYKNKRITDRSYIKKNKCLISKEALSSICSEPKAGLEPATYSLRMNCSTN